LADIRDGTTDTTRTFSFTHPTPEQSRAYTLVLKGHIAVDTAIFPKSTTGFQIDALARQFLWTEGLDYFHGTGHGVGSYLNVHEGPAGIGPRIAYNEAALKPGMVISNGISHMNITDIEPGFYKDGEFGIRIENIVIVKEVETPHQYGDRPYYGFEHVTMVPLERRLIDMSLLSEKEKQWVNNYHAEVWEKISPRVQKDGLAWNWLQRKCVPI
jgi:Xaa-Pro aminopeptidase